MSGLINSVPWPTETLHPILKTSNTGIPYNMIIKVTEFIRIGIVDSCVSKPASPFRLIHLKLNSTFTSIKTESFPKISTYVLLPAVPKFPSPPIVISSMSPADTVT